MARGGSGRGAHRPPAPQPARRRRRHRPRRGRRGDVATEPQPGSRQRGRGAPYRTLWTSRPVLSSAAPEGPACTGRCGTRPVATAPLGGGSRS